MIQQLHLRYGVAIIATGLALFVDLTVAPYVGNRQVLYILLFAAVMVVNLYAGFYPAALSLALGSVSAIALIPEVHRGISPRILIELSIIALYSYVTLYVLLSQAAYQKKNHLLAFDQHRTDSVQKAQADLLERVAKGCPLDECFEALTAAVATLQPDARAIVGLVDNSDSHFIRVFSSEIPASFGEAIKDTPVNEIALSPFGLSVFSGKPITAANIHSDPDYPQTWRELLSSHGIFACHCEPVLDPKNRAVAVFGLCFKEARHPSDWELRLARFGAHIASIAIERDRSILALRESEERFRATFNQSAFGMAQADLTGRHVMVNDAYCALTGYSRSELLECRFIDITHPEDIERNQQAFKDILSGKASSFELEKRYRQKNGSISWAQVSATLMLDANGQPCYAIAGVQDITERKRKEQMLGFLVALDWSTQPLVNPDDVMAVTAQMLGEHLGVNRCAYAETESDEDHFTITGNYNRGVNSIIGRFSMMSFGPEILRLMRSGQTYVVNDVLSDPRIGSSLPAYEATQIAALICVPILKAGHFVACMAVHQKEPRVWSAQEVELVQMVVARCWESIERARTLRNLTASEQRLRFVLDSMPQKIFTATPEGELDYLNPQWTSYAGIEFAHFRKRGERSLLHPDDLAKTHAAWKHSLQTGEQLNLEHRFRNTQGGYRWHVTRAVAMRDATGKITMWVGSNTDIHDLKQAEEAALTRSEQVQRFANIATRLNSKSDTASVMDTVTGAARELIAAHLGATSFVPGGNWEDAITSVSLSDKYQQWRSYNGEPDGSGIYALVCRSNRAMRLTQAELEAHTGWKSFGAEAKKHPPMRGWLAAPLIAADGTNIGVMQVSDKYQGEFTQDDEAVLVQLAQMTSVALENARLMEGLLDADRRKDEFLATLAHELRNPLAPMRNMMEILKHHDSQDPLIAKVHSVTERQLTHMVRLIDDLLDVSRVSRGKLDLRLEQIELAPAVLHVVESMQPSVIAAGHQLTVSLPPEPIYLRADPTRLNQILGNLLDNSCKYTKAGGNIELTVARAGSEAVITVKDNGIGIPRNKLNEIFGLFAQLDRSLERLRAGLGIGLTLVKHLVEMHDGAISAHSAGRGKGSEFIIRLPLAECTEAPVLASGKAAVEVASRRILIVDDNEDAAHSLSSLLEMSGAITSIAFDGAEALEQVESFLPQIILLDIGLPKLNGYEVCRRIRANSRCKDALIIAVSGWGQAGDRQKSSESGFDEHLVKPLDYGALNLLINTHRPVNT
ncbi:MAG TPA: PAS domain S-box protein [Cellvibrio sp.]|nr:PAS domain S-box protein [Cellvibrio sp.]